MKPTVQEIMDMLGYAALELRSYNPVNSRRLKNCWCMEAWPNGHDTGCKLMRGAVKAWRGHKGVG